MAILTPPPAAPQRGDRTTFAQRVDAFITWLINFVTELVALVSNLNSIAAGGAYAMPYVLAGPGVVGSEAGGKFFLNDYQSLAVDTKDAGGRSVAALLASFMQSTSAVKGTLKIVAQNDPSRWLVYNVINYVQDSGGRYGYISVTFVNGSDGTNSPLLWGEGIIVKFQRTGDKGDQGPAGASPQVMVIRDQKASGAAPQSLVGGSWTKRTINTTTYSSITGAFVLSDEVQLPVGIYSIEGSAPAAAGCVHQIRLFNVTDNVLYDVGTSEALGAGQSSVSRSSLRAVLVVTGSAKKYRFDHWASLTVAGGAIAGGGSAEVYSEFKITKV